MMYVRLGSYKLTLKGMEQVRACFKHAHQAQIHNNNNNNNMGMYTKFTVKTKIHRACIMTQCIKKKRERKKKKLTIIIK